MPISSITPSTPSAADQNATSGLAATSDTFLKLLVTNLQHQDPTKPQDSNEYVAQISQMTMVEQLTKLAKTQTSAAQDQQVATTIALLGKTVGYVGADGLPATGTVSRVDVTGATPTITVGGQDGIDPNTVTTVGT
jgi:flagellar basal-body rod modification protein FlgD